MKLELDFTNKTIEITESGSVAEIFDFLNKIPDIREWTIIPHTEVITVSSPPYYYPSPTTNPYPYPIDNPIWPIITYTL